MFEEGLNPFSDFSKKFNVSGEEVSTDNMRVWDNLYFENILIGKIQTIFEYRQELYAMIDNKGLLGYNEICHFVIPKEAHADSKTPREHSESFISSGFRFQFVVDKQSRSSRISFYDLESKIVCFHETDIFLLEPDIDSSEIIEISEDFSLTFPGYRKIPIHSGLVDWNIYGNDYFVELKEGKDIIARSCYISTCSLKEAREIIEKLFEQKCEINPNFDYINRNWLETMKIRPDFKKLKQNELYDPNLFLLIGEYII